MFQKLNAGRVYPIILTALILLTIMLMVRSGQAVSTVVTLRQNMVIDAGSESRQLSPSILQAAAKDSLLFGSNGAVADPFRTGITQPATVQTNSLQPDLPVYFLKLDGLLYDSNDPVVQLSYGPDSSGSIHVGDKFLNWKVQSISQRNVTLRKGSRTKVLD